jgi:organic radical activating enzyme
MKDYRTDYDLALVEKFFSTQGEGRNAGRASFFIRFAGCNAACNFSDNPEENPIPCDTPWQKAREKLTLQEMLDWLTDTRAEHLQEGGAREDPSSEEELYMVVLTGGEPTMAPAFDDLVYALKDHDFYVAIETNGTIYRDSFLEIDWISCSPKDMIHQGNPVHGEPLADSLEVADKVKNHPPDEYRYVMDGRHAEKPPYYPAERHYVSPAIISDGSGTSHYDGFPGFVPGAAERCIEIVKQDPRWRISLQTHKFLGVR